MTKTAKINFATTSEKRTAVTMSEPDIWDGVEISKTIPEHIYPIIHVALDLLQASIEDAETMQKNEWMDAIDWLFYSNDEEPWSFGWVIDLLNLAYGRSYSPAQARLNQLKNGAILNAKQEYDLTVMIRRCTKERDWIPSTQMGLISVAC